MTPQFSPGASVAEVEGADGQEPPTSCPRQPIPWPHGVWLAKTRAIVQLADGRTGRLISWPIPPEERRKPVRSLGRRAKVELAGGAMVSVRPEHVSEITT